MNCVKKYWFLSTSIIEFSINLIIFILAFYNIKRICVSKHPLKTNIYNAWGKLLSVKDSSSNTITDTTSIALINPIRYRGYVYDNESGLYYLQSRYYDPTTCRFVNEDDTGILQNSNYQLLDTNLFLYCNNNPVIRIDPKGFEYGDVSYFVSSIQMYLPNVTSSFHINRNSNYDYYNVHIPWSRDYNFTANIYAPFNMSRYEFYKRMGMPAIERTQYITVSKSNYTLNCAAVSAIAMLFTYNVDSKLLSAAVGFTVGQKIGSEIADPGDYKIVQTITYAKTSLKPELYDLMITLDAYKKGYDSNNKVVWTKYHDKGKKGTWYYPSFTKDDFKKIINSKLYMNFL